ncbi:MAG: hypothetical protein AB1489_40935, partial [Acidobacteriota bacterium]
MVYNKESYQSELMTIKRLEGPFASTLSALVRIGQIDRELLSYSAKALELAFSLFPNDSIAFQIALDAALNVKRTANEREHRRKYYKAGKKTKVLLNRIQIFQQMILCESQ